MGRAVCRKCWTWHGSGATVCPRCGAPLAAGNQQLPDNVPPSLSPVTSPVQPAAAPKARPAVTAAPRVRPRRRRFVVIVAGVVVLGIAATLLVLQWSARAVSTDGSFSVQVPSGWVHFTGRSLPDGGMSTNESMVLLGPISDGVQAHLVVTSGLNQPTCGLALTATRASAATRTTVAGSAASITDCRTSSVGVEVITVNHQNHIYTIVLTSASRQFDQLRAGALHDLLASWRWN